MPLDHVFDGDGHESVQSSKSAPVAVLESVHQGEVVNLYHDYCPLRLRVGVAVSGLVQRYSS